MLPCEKCSYRQDIPSDTHSRCVFDWMAHDLMGLTSLIAKSHLTPKTARWFQFPFTYDPVWGPDDCPNRAETRDAVNVVPDHPLTTLLSLLGGR